MSIRNCNPFQVRWKIVIRNINQWNSFFQKNVPFDFITTKSYSNPSGIPGSGGKEEGKDGGVGGSIRESGDSLGQYGTAQEEQFFYNKQREQLEKMKKKLKKGKLGDMTQKEEKHD